MVATCDSKRREEVVQDSPYERWPGQRRRSSQVQAGERDEDNKRAIQPIDLLVPIT